MTPSSDRPKRERKVVERVMVLNLKIFLMPHSLKRNIGQFSGYVWVEIETTLSDILQQLGIHFDQDLMHRKAKVKDIITNVINNMSDEDEEGNESDENADIGGGANKYCDGDDDA
ncbi:hypothetical protein ES288_D13G167100v1 [Gossypium darwinii]|uniref:Uncharacterized protein n=1 Tax=Gossypium darwinii TaxID=34276 RepID=A0A5D1ZYR2_GOSDA|nr:hypothetical protein ES288_D13G167100v1 [Gossypium darwinii]